MSLNKRSLIPILLLLASVSCGSTDGSGGVKRIPNQDEVKNKVGEKTPDVCGDGILSVETEECDDGNNSDSDGCSATCLIEKGWDCSGGRCKIPVCGDGIVAIGREQCDDGNTNDGDGCSATCLVEKGWGCDSFHGTPEWIVFPQYFHIFPSSDILNLNCIQKGSLQPRLYNPTKDPSAAGLLLLNAEAQERCSEEEKQSFNRWFIDNSSYGEMFPTFRGNFRVNFRLHQEVGNRGSSSYTLSIPHKDALGGSGEAPRNNDDSTLKPPPPDYVTINFKVFFQYFGKTQDLKFKAYGDLWVFVNNHLALDGGGRSPYRDLLLPFKHSVDPVTGKPENQDFGLKYGGIYEFSTFANTRDLKRYPGVKPKEDLMVNIPLVIVGPSYCAPAPQR